MRLRPAPPKPSPSPGSAAKSKPIIAEPEIHGAQPLDGVTGFLVLMSEGLYKALEAAHGPGQANQVSWAALWPRQSLFSGLKAGERKSGGLPGGLALCGRKATAVPRAPVKAKLGGQFPGQMSLWGLLDGCCSLETGVLPQVLADPGAPQVYPDPFFISFWCGVSGFI